MIYVTGDTHGRQRKWKREIEPKLSKGDILIIAGDFGIGFWDGPFWSEELFYDHIAKQPFTVLFLDGNHENFNKLSAYPIEEWNGGNVQKLRPNLIHLMRGQVYRIEGKTIFTMGGGYSLDKEWRTENVDWWPQEMPSDQEYQEAEENLSKADTIDYVITHTAPAETVYRMSTMRSLGIKDGVYEEAMLTGFLEGIRSKITYGHWYFGHFHVDAELWRDQTAIFNCIRELESGKVIHSWECYEGQ